MTGRDELHARFTAAGSGSPYDVARSALWRAVAETVRNHPARNLVTPEIDVLLTRVHDDHLAGRVPEPTALDSLNEAIWSRLSNKHGNSTSIVDAEDRLLRGALVLASDPGEHEIRDTIGWASEMLADDPWPRALKYF